MARLDITLPKEVADQIRSNAAEGGWHTISAYVRSVLEFHMSGRKGLLEIQDAVVSSLDAIRRDYQIMYAAQDIALQALARIPEPPKSLNASVKARYDEFTDVIAAKVAGKRTPKWADPDGIESEPEEDDSDEYDEEDAEG